MAPFFVRLPFDIFKIIVYCFYLCINLNTQFAGTGMRSQSERIFARYFTIYI